MAARPGVYFRFDPREPPNPHIRVPARFVRPEAVHFIHPEPPRFEPGVPLVEDVPPLEEILDTPMRPQKRQALLPPLSSSVSIEIIQDVARATITHEFHNSTDSVISKGTYQFPLPHGSSVVDFSCRFNQHILIKGVVKPKETARREFEEAVGRGRTAGLLEEDTPEIFKATVGNIPANSKLSAEISFVFFLKHRLSERESSTTLTLPTYIAPRYGAAPVRLDQPPSSSATLSLSVNVLSSDGITDISSKTHLVTVTHDAERRRCQRWADFVQDDPSHNTTTARVTLADSITHLDKDFVLDITARPSEDTHQPQACLEVLPNQPEQKAIMLTIPPRFMLQHQAAVHGGEIIFVADRSGSMDDKISSLRSAMDFFLRGIPRDHKFNIWCFGTHHTSLWPRCKEYNQQNLGEALGYVSSNFRADMGGTELLPALQALFAARNKRAPLDVIILTDGEVWRHEETIEFVAKTRLIGEGMVRVFALGIGNAVSHDLVEGLATAGGGYAEVIPAASAGDWEDRIVAVLKAASAGHIGPISIELGSADRDNRNEDVDAFAPPKIQMSPVDASSLSPFTRCRIFILLDPRSGPVNNAISINASAASGEQIITRVPIMRLEMPDTIIHKLAARSLLGDLQRGESWIHRHPGVVRKSQEERGLVDREGERLGCKWSLASKWTSFFAVKERVQEQPLRPANAGKVHAEEPEQGDMELLRPRIPAGQAELNVLPVGGVGAEEGNENDSDGDDDTESVLSEVNSVLYKSHQDDDDNGAAGGNTGINTTWAAGGSRGSGGNPGSGGNTENCGAIANYGSAGNTWVAGNTASSRILGIYPIPQAASVPRRYRPQAALRYSPRAPSRQAQSRYSPQAASVPQRYSPEAPSFNAPPAPFPEEQPTNTSDMAHLVSTPAYNPPASTSLLEPSIQQQTPSGETTQAKLVSYVRRTIHYQQSNGCFEVRDPVKSLSETIGPSVYTVVLQMNMYISFMDLAVTVTLVALFEERLASCKGHWELAATKALEYIREMIRNKGLLRYPSPEAAVEEAKTLVRTEVDMRDITENGDDEEADANKQDEMRVDPVT